MLIEELADIMEVSVPSVRKYINNIDKNNVYGIIKY